MLTIPTPDGVAPFLYLLSPLYFFTSIPFILLIETAVLWKMGFGPPEKAGLYTLIMNIASTLAGVIIAICMFPYPTGYGQAGMPFPSLILFNCSLVFIWFGMLIFSIKVEEYVLKRLVPTHPKIRRAVVICNILSYLVILFLFPLFLGEQGFSYGEGSKLHWFDTIFFGPNPN